MPRPKGSKNKPKTAPVMTEKVKAAEETKKDSAKKESVKESIKAVKDTVEVVAKESVNTAKELAGDASEAVKKAAKTVKENRKAAPARKAAIKETVYLQYLGKEICDQDLVKQVKEIWTKQLKRKVGEIKSITLYLKPEENAAYYVVNDEVDGKIEL